MKLNKEFICHPTVFAIEDSYQIILPVKSEMLFWVEVDGVKYYDHSCGILVSSTLIHKVALPMKALNRAKKYTVCYKKIIDRKPYFPETEELVEITYKFHPITGRKPIKFYHVSDAHGRVEASVSAAKARFGKDIDLLVLNGDIANHSGNFENICMLYQIASGITEGKKPCIFSRGNHDMRGAMAEKLADFTPTAGGLTYFTFRLGSLWGVVLDCAEDKLDTNEEYGGTICCHEYRLAETEFLKSVVKSKKYASKGIKHRIVISHLPFTIRNFEDDGIFDIENDIFSEWVKLLNDGIKPDLLLSGHFHRCETVLPSDELDHRGQTFPVVIGAKPGALNGESGFSGSAIVFEDNEISLQFTDSLGNTEDKINL